MTNTVELSELHGTTVKNDDFRFSEERRRSFDLEDEVFLAESTQSQTRNLSLPPILEQGALSKDYEQTSHLPVRSRKVTSLSSGFVSDLTLSNSDSDCQIFAISRPQQNKTSTVTKTKRDVASQTDFSSDEEINDTYNTQPVAVKVTSMNARNFCWRHDDIYEEIFTSPARPPCSPILNKIDEKNNENYDAEPKKTISFSNKSCQKCKECESEKIHLRNRKETFQRTKTPVTPRVANVQNCPANLLADNLHRCSELWTENRTFFLGTSSLVEQTAKRQRSLSTPTRCSDLALFNKHQEINLSCSYCQDENGEKTMKFSSPSCSRHLFWIRSLSLPGVDSLSKNKENPNQSRPKRDWILVQCVKRCESKSRKSFDDEKTFFYRECGEQKLILCPPPTRSVEEIENLCCQQFLNKTRSEALEEHRNVTILFSPQGPELRENKHLLGKSIFYFCCDLPYDKRRKSTISAENTENIDADVLLDMANSGKRPSVGIFGPHRRNSEQKSSTTLSKRSTGKKQKNKKDNKEGNDAINEMKKTVTFADGRKTEPNTKQAEDELSKRRTSLPPPPPQYLGSKIEDFEARRKKRRESVAISFGNAPVGPRKETIEETRKPDKPVYKYKQPEFENVKITITFKEEKYSTEFPEYKTLQDLYAWVRQELLRSDALTPGANLLLSYDNLKFPLKANTASNAVSNLPSFDLLCEQIQEANQGGRFGDTNSRFDTRFSLPIDLRALKGVSPIQYLSKHCIVSATWRAFYCNTFHQNDRDRDGHITYKELSSAMERLFVELAHPLLRRVLFLLGFDPKSKSNVTFQKHFHTNEEKIENKANERCQRLVLTTWQDNLSIDKETFVCICALANRIICRENNIDGYPVDTIKQSGTQLEDADFYNIEGKLREYELNPLTKRLLLYLKR
ncbi:unnamed protein product [Clavelina lepadiformis]|uniref:EF-hand domain-containing protein n=1 Tax=Clavelina lepadiformis TaxID=159417 RepID=A0ABP0H3V1_CLALP